jgi:hypothetical protein
MNLEISGQYQFVDVFSTGIKSAFSHLKQCLYTYITASEQHWGYHQMQLTLNDHSSFCALYTDYPLHTENIRAIVCP